MNLASCLTGLTCATLLALGSPFAVTQAIGQDLERELSAARAQFFENQVRPILVEHCLECHGPNKPEGNLRLDSRAAMIHGGDSGSAMTPGDTDQSLIIEAIRYDGLEMPPSKQLDPKQIEILTKWVRIGAPWPKTAPIRLRPANFFTEEDRSWWAIQPVLNHKVPQASTWAMNEIDAFIESGLVSNDLKPADVADRETLIRRLYFNLIGLPPTPEAVDQFVNDPDPKAYETLVDQLLDDPRYGERWARHWLDLTRYADSDGYKADHLRPNAWRYRDYVIRSLNEDKPYDRFMQEQLAGDELFPNDPDALIATGYFRNGIYEYNSREADKQLDIMLNEITDTTGDVFLGLGMQCARCHDHKFDPIRQKDYFRLRAFFEPLQFLETTVATSDQQQDYLRDSKNWEEKTKSIREELAQLEAPYRKQAEETAVIKFSPELQATYRKNLEARTPRDHQIANFVARQVKFEYSKMESKFKPADKEKILALRRELAKHKKLKPVELPVARIVSDVGVQSPKTMIPGTDENIKYGPISILDPSTAKIETPKKRIRSTGRRTALARWLSDPTNPLSTRVVVNRIWKYHFGRGLAPNSSDFGLLGGRPSHPELLDWLTTKFVEDGWSLKKLHRRIVLSSTYRQSTAHSEFEKQAIADPVNQWYWRADTRRLDAEQVRDAILAVSGQLNLRQGGPGVRTDQPYRTIYTSVRRNTRDPLLDSFDLPLFFSSAGRRDTTTTPLQSLLLINSQTMLRHASLLAQHAQKNAGSNEQTVVNLWRLALGRRPSETELADAIAFLHNQTGVIEERRKQKENDFDPNAFQTGKFPYRSGQAMVFEPKSSRSFEIAHDENLNVDEFTIEAFFQVSSVYESGSVRTIASKWDGNRKTPGWAIGVTGKGSRRKPQTMVIQLFGDNGKASVAEAAIFSDQHVELKTPYYVAVSVQPARRVSGNDRKGNVTFFLKDLSNDDEPISIVNREHSIRSGIQNQLPFAIGREKAKRGMFDGLIDDVRISAGALQETELLYSKEGTMNSTIGYWQFESSPGILHDSSENGLTIENDGSNARKNRHAAIVDLCHVLLNSNEFLYID